MSYTLTITEKQGVPRSLTVSGLLTIKTSLALHAELLEHAKKQEGMQLEVTDVEDLDVTFLQLLLALGKYHNDQQKPFRLQLDLNPGLSHLMQLAGITKALNTNLS